MHVHCLHCLMSIDLLLQSAFSDHVNPRLVKWHQRRPPIWQWGSDMAPTVSTRLSKPCNRIFVGPLWVHVDVIATLNSTNVSSCFFVLAFATTHPPPIHPPCPSYSSPYIHWSNINEFHEKNLQKLAKIGHYLLARLVVQKLIDN